MQLKPTAKEASSGLVPPGKQSFAKKGVMAAQSHSANMKSDHDAKGQLTVSLSLPFVTGSGSDILPDTHPRYPPTS